jgi:hypothetical protein
MGWCQTSVASIGIKILLKDLFLCKSKKLIKDILLEGFIDDDNEFFNEEYQDIIYSYDDIKEIKEELSSRGTIIKDRFSDFQEQDVSQGTLLDKYLLIPIDDILETSRWGHGRSGVNGTYRSLDFNLSLDLPEKYKKLKNIEIVFMLKQSSG